MGHLDKFKYQINKADIFSISIFLMLPGKYLYLKKKWTVYLQFKFNQIPIFFLAWSGNSMRKFTFYDPFIYNEASYVKIHLEKEWRQGSAKECKQPWWGYV